MAKKNVANQNYLDFLKKIAIESKKSSQSTKNMIKSFNFAQTSLKEAFKAGDDFVNVIKDLKTKMGGTFRKPSTEVRVLAHEFAKLSKSAGNAYNTIDKLRQFRGLKLDRPKLTPAPIDPSFKLSSIPKKSKFDKQTGMYSGLVRHRGFKSSSVVRPKSGILGPESTAKIGKFRESSKAVREKIGGKISDIKAKGKAGRLKRGFQVGFSALKPGAKLLGKGKEKIDEKGGISKMAKSLGAKGVQKSTKSLASMGKMFKSAAMLGGVGAVMSMVKGFSPLGPIMNTVGTAIKALSSIASAELAPALKLITEAFFSEESITFAKDMGAAILPIVELFFSPEAVAFAQQMGTALLPIVDNIVGFVTALADSGAFAAIGKLLLMIFEGFAAITGADAFILLATNIGNLVTTVVNALEDSGAMEMLSEAIIGIVESINGVFEDNPDLGDQMGKIAVDLATMASQFFTVIGDLLPIIIPLLVPLIGFMTSFGVLMGKMATALSGFLNDNKDAIIGFFGGIIGFVNKIIGGVNKILPENWKIPTIAMPSLEQQGIIQKSGIAEVHAGEAVVKTELITEIFKTMNVTNNFDRSASDTTRMQYTDSMRNWMD